MIVANERMKETKCTNKGQLKIDSNFRTTMKQ